MKSNAFTFKRKNVLLLLTLFFSFMLTFSYPIYAYFKASKLENIKPTMDISLLFGRLDENLASGPWGSDQNPYLISNTDHLQNLYVLQNSPDSFLINESSVFQVSDSQGYPVYVGSTNVNQLLEMKSIGNEQYPFISQLRGVTTTNQSKYIQLPSGEFTDTSVLGNLKITPVPGQVDIGLFGNMGRHEGVDPENPATYQGGVSNILLYNIQVQTNQVGTHIASHHYNVSGGKYETNHIGILVGHAQYVNLEKISVYYSTINNVAQVNAFDVQAGDQAKYTTSGGIVGFYKRVVIDGETQHPVSSGDTSIGVGNDQTGLGMGIVYSTDIWDFMEEKTNVGKPAPSDSYNLQETLKDVLYGDDKSYFHVGVFTFAHSLQAHGRDRLAKLWPSSAAKNWTIATNGDDGYTLSTKNMGTAKKYVATRITNAHFGNITASTSYASLSTNNYGNQSNYRYMLTYRDNTTQKEYALIRYGATALGEQIDPSNLVIKESDLPYYTFALYKTQVPDTAYPPYEEGFASKYTEFTPLQFNRGSSNINLQYMVYGAEIYDPDQTSLLKEAPRPLRIYALGNDTPTASFMTTSISNFKEGVRFVPPSNTRTFNTFKIQRTTGTNGTMNAYLTFNPATGFSATTSQTNATSFNLYAVRVSNNPSNSNENPTNTNYLLEDYQVKSNAPSATYNMEESVLYYTGTYTDSDPETRYLYKMRSISDLNWYDNEDKLITKADTMLAMSDPTSYYYVNNRFFGVKLNIPSPIKKGATINVPEGSIGFTVNGNKNPNGMKAKINVIVATDPSQGFEQHITVSRFGTGTNQNADRQILDRLILPPAPGTSITKTQAIYLQNETSNAYKVYPGFNTLLVAYTFEVPVQTVEITYFLEASRGSARFVYLAGERLAANDHNPKHENDVKIPNLGSIDYVYSLTKTVNNITNSRFVATVGTSDYSASLTVPYFGFTNNPEFDEATLPLKDRYIITAVNGFNFTYKISRIYDPNTDEKYHLYISILANMNGSGYTPTITLNQLKTIQQNMNFNYSENSYMTPEYEFVYSDRVIMNINGYLLEDWTVLK